MAGVFDALMTADGMRDAFHVHRQAADKIACGISLFFVALRHQHHDGDGL